MGGAGLKCALIEMIGGVNVCTALKVDIEEEEDAGIVLVLIIGKDDEVLDEVVVKLSILRLLGLVSGSGVGVLVGVTSNWTAFRTLGGPLA